MSHLLAKLKNVPIEFIKEILEKDRAFHAENKMYLKHLWQNADDEHEVLFLFEIESIENTKRFINKLHSEALEQNPEANLPTMTYLE